jgi:hypothetical protein
MQCITKQSSAIVRHIIRAQHSRHQQRRNSNSRTTTCYSTPFLPIPTHLLAVLLAMRWSERLVSARSPRMLPTTACSCCRLLLSDEAASDCAAPAVQLLSASQEVNADSTWPNMTCGCAACECGTSGRQKVVMLGNQVLAADAAAGTTKEDSSWSRCGPVSCL